MGLRTMLAKSALKYAADTFNDMRKPREVRNDLGPVLAKLDTVIANQPPLWMYYAILGVSILSLILSIWALALAF